MRRLLLAVLTVAALGVSGCSSGTSAPTLSDTAARQLQADVLAVTKSAATHDWTTARDALSTLRADLAKAKAAGTVSTARAASIEAAIATVSADLTGASTTAPVPTTSTTASKSPSPKPTKTRKGGGHGGGDGGH